MGDFPYMTNAARIGQFFSKVQEVGRPEKVSAEWLATIGFRSSNDRPIISIMKFLKFADDSGIPVERWQSYRDTSQGRAVMAQALREGYNSLFQTYPDAHRKDDAALQSFFSTKTGVGTRTVGYMVRTFKALVELADFGVTGGAAADKVKAASHREDVDTAASRHAVKTLIPITMNIQVVIPSDATAEQYDKIFSSIKKFLTPQD